MGQTNHFRPHMIGRPHVVRRPRLMCLVSSTDDLALLPALAMAGVDAFQVRDKTLDRDRLVAFTQHVMALVPAAKVIVNDRLDVAITAGADGVHLGASDLPIASARAMVDRAVARRFLMPGFLVGATCRSSADLSAATAAGADYAGTGPVFATTSKAGLPEPLGIEGLRAALSACTNPSAPDGEIGTSTESAGSTVSADALPVLAIGGITADNAPEVIAAGAHGVAVIGGIWNDPDPVLAAKRLTAVVGA